jgi:hypothetical protein
LQSLQREPTDHDLVLVKAIKLTDMASFRLEACS